MMSISSEDIEKYIFDPENPKKCKSYNLLLSIVKKECLTFVDNNYLEFFLQDQIVNEKFNSEVWDKPDNYNEMDFISKKNVYISNLSFNDYSTHIDTLDLKTDNIFYNKIFKFFFTFRDDTVSEIMDAYSTEIIKDIITNNLSSYSRKYETSYFSSNYYKYSGSKVLFTDSFNSLSFDIDEKFFDFACVNIINIEKENYYLDGKINKHIKPLFLKNINDLKLLLTVLENDLKKVKSKSIEKEEVSYIDKVKVKDFFSINDLEINNLFDKKEIYIVGENGDGKTLFLQSIAIALKGVKEGEVFNLVKTQKDFYSLTAYDKNAEELKEYKNLLAYGAGRNGHCQIKEDETGYLTLFDNGLDLKDPIEWLKYLDHSEKSGKENIISVEKAKSIFKNLLNSDIEIDISPDEVVFKEKGSVVPFSQLSAGYQGVITIVCDMLVRLSENQPYVLNTNDYKGVVLIDEVELHLHPKWKYNFIKNLREIFPSIQFIVTTHSPTVLLGASKEAVFYKIYKENGEVFISNQMENEGYTNNTIISSPLFDLDTITSREYKKIPSGDDYIYEKIHKQVKEKISKEISTNEDEILELIDKELEEYDKSK